MSQNPLTQILQSIGAALIPSNVPQVAPKNDVTMSEIDPIEEAVRTKALALLQGRGSSGAGAIPQIPNPVIDYGNMLNMLANQQVIASNYTPRTLGMTIDEVQSQHVPITAAMDNQMKQLSATSIGANAQKEQQFDNEMKRWQAQLQAANSGRSEIAQYLSMAHQISQDKRRDALLERQLRRDEIVQGQKERELNLRQRSIDARTDKLSEDTKRVAAYVPSLKTPGVNEKELKAIMENPNYGPILARRIQTRWKNMDSDIIRSTPAQKDAEARTIVQEFVKDVKTNPDRIAAQSSSNSSATDDPENMLRKALFGGGI